MVFTLDEREKKLYKAWDAAHIRDLHGGEHPYTGAVGGRVAFVIFGTGIGDFLSAECLVCKRANLPRKDYAIDLTDVGVL